MTAALPGRVPTDHVQAAQRGRDLLRVIRNDTGTDAGEVADLAGGAAPGDIRAAGLTLDRDAAMDADGLGRVRIDQGKVVVGRLCIARAAEEIQVGGGVDVLVGSGADLSIGARVGGIAAALKRDAAADGYARAADRLQPLRVNERVSVGVGAAGDVDVARGDEDRLVGRAIGLLDLSGGIADAGVATLDTVRSPPLTVTFLESAASPIERDDRGAEARGGQLTDSGGLNGPWKAIDGHEAADVDRLRGARLDERVFVVVESGDERGRSLAAEDLQVAGRGDRLGGGGP